MTEADKMNSSTTGESLVVEIATDAMTAYDALDRIKAAPVCVDTVLQKQSMTAEFLSQWVFPTDTIFPVGSSHTPTTTTMSRILPSASSCGGSWSRSSVASSGTNATTSQIEATPSLLPQSDHVPLSVVSVSSNNSCAGDSHAGALSADEMTEIVVNQTKQPNTASSSSPSSTIAALKLRSILQPPSSSSSSIEHDASCHLNAKVVLRKTSRQGRSTQRWVTVPSQIQASGGGGDTGSSKDLYASHHTSIQHHHEPLMRLVTGCVPILRNGKILFVSASRKSAWILPKGGWEQDESIEESAVRECFEEAGCLGTLGPALTAVQHETRKAKKRRLEQEQFLEQHFKKSLDAGIPPAVLAEPDEKIKLMGEDSSHTNGCADDSTDDVGASVRRASSTSPSTIAPEVLSAEALSRIRRFSMSSRYPTDTETMSVGSTMSTTYTHVQMTLFPLYVQKIEDSWPEQGRFRRAVDIDEAIAMLENRPELQAALVEVKERGLHLVDNAKEMSQTVHPNV